MVAQKKKKFKKSMQLNEAVPSKYSNGEIGRDCGMIQIFLKPVSFISSSIKQAAAEGACTGVSWQEWVAKTHMETKSGREQSQPRYLRIYL